jgi:hypothetical protein
MGRLLAPMQRLDLRDASENAQLARIAFTRNTSNFGRCSPAMQPLGAEHRFPFGTIAVLKRAFAVFSLFAGTFSV